MGTQWRQEAVQCVRSVAASVLVAVHRWANFVQNNDFWSKKSLSAQSSNFKLKFLTQDYFLLGVNQAESMEAAFMVNKMHTVRTKTLSGPRYSNQNQSTAG